MYLFLLSSKYPEDRALLSRKAKKAAKEIAEKQAGANAAASAAKVDTTDVIIPSRTKHSMGGVALRIMEKKRELRRKMEETRERLNREAEEEKRRAKERKKAIMGMRK